MTPLLLPQIPRIVRRCNKHSYPSKKDAQTAINHRTRGHQRNRPSLLRAYYCPRCSKWHLTHQEEP